MGNKWRDGNRKYLSEQPENSGLDWSNRTACCAEIIIQHHAQRVFDFGSGECNLYHPLLLHCIEYYGFDTENIHNFPFVTKIDLENNLPNLNNLEQSDIATCLGFFEYFNIKRTVEILDFLKSNFNTVIYSTTNSIEKNINTLFENSELITELRSKPSSQKLFIWNKK